MGTIYLGLYHEEINTYDNEGYDARVMPDGTETGTLRRRVRLGRVHRLPRPLRLRGPGTTVYRVPDPDPLDSDEADREWMREHIEPMVNQARRQTWPAWSKSAATRTASAADAITAGRYADALTTMQQMRDDLDAAAHRDRPSRTEAMTTS